MQTRERIQPEKEHTAGFSYMTSWVRHRYEQEGALSREGNETVLYIRYHCRLAQIHGTYKNDPWPGHQTIQEASWRTELTLGK